MESTPLLSTSGGTNTSHARTNSSNNPSYYFLNKDESYQGGITDSVRDADGGNVVEEMPAGALEEEFAPRPLVLSNRQVTNGGVTMTSGRGNLSSSNAGGGVGGFLSRLFGGGRGAPESSQRNYGEVGTLLKLRKAPVKIEPKVFFANERTFLAWMHLSVILAGASIAILAFAEEQNPYSQLYGVLMLPVAIAFIVYSMYQYARRASMIRHRHPGPYEDTTGPAVLGVMLMLSILAQFVLKLYSMRYNM